MKDLFIILLHFRYSEKVSALTLRLSVEPTFALVHPCPGEGVKYCNQKCAMGPFVTTFIFITAS
jgi:hypothetical protein